MNIEVSIYLFVGLLAACVSVFLSFFISFLSFLYQSMTPEELEEKVYDRFDIELKQLQILMVKPGWYFITLKYSLYKNNSCSLMIYPCE